MDSVITPMSSSTGSAGSQLNKANPYDAFIETLLADENPNFLWYTLCMMETHAYHQQAECLRAIREVMEKKYNITKENPFRLKK